MPNFLNSPMQHVFCNAKILIGSPFVLNVPFLIANRGTSMPPNVHIVFAYCPPPQKKNPCLQQAQLRPICRYDFVVLKLGCRYTRLAIWKMIRHGSRASHDQVCDCQPVGYSDRWCRALETCLSLYPTLVSFTSRLLSKRSNFSTSRRPLKQTVVEISYETS